MDGLSVRVMNAPAILVVEDDAVIRSLLAEYLTDLGYRVSTAEDGEMALRRAVQEPPRLVLADVMLPKLSGLDLVRRLRADRRTVGTAIVAMSAVTNGSIRAECRQAGCDDFLPKPFDLDALEARIACLAGVPSPDTVTA